MGFLVVMSSFLKKIKLLFSSENGHVAKPMVRSSLKRSSTFTSRYDAWVKEKGYQEIKLQINLNLLMDLILVNLELNILIQVGQ